MFVCNMIDVRSQMSPWGWRCPAFTNKFCEWLPGLLPQSESYAVNGYPACFHKQHPAFTNKTFVTHLATRRDSFPFLLFLHIIIRQPPLWGHQAVRVQAQVSEFSYQCLDIGYRISDLHSLLGIGDWGPQKPLKTHHPEPRCLIFDHHVGPMLAPSWRHVGPSWRHLGTFEKFGGSWNLRPNVNNPEKR